MYETNGVPMENNEVDEVLTVMMQIAKRARPSEDAAELVRKMRDSRCV